MALVGNDLGDAMKAAMDGLTAFDTGAFAGETFEAYRTRMFRALGASIVTYITANAEIGTTVTVTSVSGVTVGPGTSGPGSGSGSGTIS